MLFAHTFFVIIFCLFVLKSLEIFKKIVYTQELLKSHFDLTNFVFECQKNECQKKKEPKKKTKHREMPSLFLSTFTQQSQSSQENLSFLILDKFDKTFENKKKELTWIMPTLNLKQRMFKEFKRLK